MKDYASAHTAKEVQDAKVDGKNSWTSESRNRLQSTQFLWKGKKTVFRVSATW